MLVPAAIKPGDKIRIVSPAGKVKPEYVLPAVDWLTKEGYRVELGRNVFSQHYQFAGTDAQRHYDLQEALDDPDTAVILCSRGGYGTVRILNKINYNEFYNHPKWLVGFSDITIIHSCFNNHRMASIHGVMPRYFFDKSGQPGKSLLSLMRLLKGDDILYSISPAEGNRQGTGIGELAGGNLSVISSMQGTACELETTGKILFLEDIDEFLYHTDRMMYQLKLSGKLDNLAGLILGNFSDMKDNESPFGKSVHEIIGEAVEQYGFPICFDFPAGHDEVNLALAFGLKWVLSVKSEVSELKLVRPQVLSDS
jgi:muramoyltetrapeptide carboxypeptidase